MITHYILLKLFFSSVTFKLFFFLYYYLGQFYQLVFLVYAPNKNMKIKFKFHYREGALKLLCPRTFLLFKCKSDNVIDSI